MFKPQRERDVKVAGWYRVEGTARDKWGNYLNFAWSVFAMSKESAPTVALLEMGRLMLKTDPLSCQGQGLVYIPSVPVLCEPCSPPWNYFQPTEEYENGNQE